MCHVGATLYVFFEKVLCTRHPLVTKKERESLGIQPVTRPAGPDGAPGLCADNNRGPKKTIRVSKWGIEKTVVTIYREMSSGVGAPSHKNPAGRRKK